MKSEQETIVLEKADYTNLERLKGYVDCADDIPSMLARYLKEFDFCVNPEKACKKYQTCESCISDWLHEKAEIYQGDLK